MSEPTLCPKCDSPIAAIERDGHRRTVFACGSVCTNEAFEQSEGCRVKELTAENKDLAGRLLGMTNVASAAVGAIDEFSAAVVAFYKPGDIDARLARWSAAWDALVSFDAGDNARALLSERDALRLILHWFVGNGSAQVALETEDNAATREFAAKVQEANQLLKGQ